VNKYLYIIFTATAILIVSAQFLPHKDMNHHVGRVDHFKKSDSVPTQIIETPGPIVIQLNCPRGQGILGDNGVAYKENQFWGPRTVMGNMYFLKSDAIIKRIVLPQRPNTSSDSVSLRVAIYEDESNKPKNQKILCDWQGSAANGLNIFNVNDVFLPAGNYWLLTEGLAGLGVEHTFGVSPGFYGQLIDMPSAYSDSIEVFNSLDVRMWVEWCAS
jgi:hypothetical protein